jgi:hypothetical protein
MQTTLSSPAERSEGKGTQWLWKRETYKKFAFQFCEIGEALLPGSPSLALLAQCSPGMTVIV